MDPVDTFHDAIQSVWSRAILCGFCIVAPYLFLPFAEGGLATFPVFVFMSFATGWGFLVYPLLLIFYVWFLRSESSYYFLILPFVISGIDLWRMVLLLRTWT